MRWFCLLGAIAWAHIGMAAYNFDKNNLAAYHELLALRLGKVEPLLEASLRDDPQNGITLYLQNLCTVVKILTTDDRELYAQHLKAESDFLKTIQALDKNSPYYLFVLSEVRLQNGVARLKMGDQISAFMSFQKAYSLAAENAKKYPGFLPTMRSMGLYQSVLYSIPAEYRWVVNLLGFRSKDFSYDAGRKNLETVAASGTVFAAEAQMLMLLIDSHIYAKHESSFLALNQWLSQSPNHVMLALLTAIVGIHAGKSRQVKEILLNLPSGEPYPAIPYLEYLKCETSLFLGQYDECIAFGKKFIAQTKGTNLLKSAYYRIFLAYWMKGDMTEAETFRQLTLRKGTANIPQDQSAYHNAAITPLPDRNLMQARLFFDGGEYDKALQIMQKTTISPANQHEYLYRMARIFHGKKDFTQALHYYAKAIAADTKMNTLFGANSCLQSGYIYADALKDPVKAKEFFLKTLQFKGYPGKEGIDYRARAAAAAIQ